MKVCFACGTVYQIFVAYILSIGEYKNCAKILVIADSAIKSCRELVVRLKDLAIWDEVILIHEKDTPVEQVESQVNAVIAREFDVLHFFSYGHLFSRIFLNNIPDCMRVILTEEGKMTYKPIAEYNKWRQYFVYNSGGLEQRYSVIDWDRIDEVWVFDPRLRDGSLARPVKEIDLSSILKDPEETKEAINKLNYIFDYQYKDNHFEIVYFDNYFSSINILSLAAERYFLSKVNEIREGYDLYIKTHPGEEKGLAEIRFEGLNVKFINNSVPWEVIYLNHIFHHGDDKLVLLAPSSTAAHNSILIGKYFGINQCYLVLLVDILKDYLRVNILEDDREYIMRFIKVYGRDRVFLPQTFIEAKEVIRSIFASRPDQIKKIEFKDLYNEVNKELTWLKKQYLNCYQYLPDYICRSVLVADYGVGFEWEKLACQWFDTRKDSFNLEFAVFPKGKAKKLLWLPVSERIFGKIKIEEIKIKTGEGETSNISGDRIKTDLPMDDDKYFVFNFTNPAIEINVNQEITSVSIKGKIYFEDTYKKMVRVGRENISGNEIINRRTNQYYQLLTKWLKLYQKETNITEYFIKHNFLKIAIYGSGEIGKLLYAELHQSPIQLVTFVNENGINNGITLCGRKISVMGIDEFLVTQGMKEIDAVIVTPIYDYQKIKHALSIQSSSYQIVSIDEIISSLLDKH